MMEMNFTQSMNEGLSERGEEMKMGATHTRDDNSNNNNDKSAGAASKGVSFECTPTLQSTWDGYNQNERTKTLPTIWNQVLNEQTNEPTNV